MHAHKGNGTVVSMAVLVVTLGALLSFARDGHAQTRVFVQVPNIAGEAIDAGFRQQIDAVSFSTGANASLDGTTKPTLEPFVITKSLDSASIPLAFAALQGTIFPSITVTVATPARGGLRVVSTFKLRNALVTNVHMTTASGDGAPVEQVIVAFTQLEATYVAVDPMTGASRPVTSTWDTLRNK